MPGQMIIDIPASYTKYVFINEQKSLNFGFTEDIPYRSNTEISITQLGNQQVTMWKDTQLYQFTINNVLHCLDTQQKIFANILKASPKYIIVNKTTRLIEIAQINNKQKLITIEINQKKNWIWPIKNNPKKIIIRIVDNQLLRSQRWDFSSPIQLQTIQDTIIIIRPISRIQYKILIRIEIFKSYQQKYIILHQIKPTDNFYLIKNDLKFVRLKIYQKYLEIINPIWNDYKHFQIESGQSVHFGWDYPNQSHIIVITLQFIGPLRSKYINTNIQIDLNSSEKVYNHRIYDEQTNQYSMIVLINIQTLGLRHTITFNIKNEQQQQQNNLQQLSILPHHSIGLSIIQIGISLISGSNPRNQISYLCIKKLEVIIMEKYNIRNLQLKIKFLSIDNNSNHNTMYPVLLTPLKYRKTMDKQRPFIVMLIEQNLNNKDMINIKQFRLCFQPISLKLHDEILVSIYDMFKEIQKIGLIEQKFDLSEIFRAKNNLFQWQQNALLHSDNAIFFQQFQIAKLKIQISFCIRPKIHQNNYIIFTILSSFGVAISNVSQSQLTLNRFFMKQVTSQQIFNSISEFYIKQFMRGIYKVLGSINILGNPYVFLRYMLEGTWEIVNQPTQGFIKGPIQGTLGFFKGGILFTRNAVAGTFNSLEVITDSVSRGISFVTTDQKFIERRQKIKIQKSQHVLDGLWYGLFSVYTGCQVAVTGLVRHPASGYQSRGLVGGVTGTFKGLTGLITQPISGIFEGISKVSQGIKNTALFFQDGPYNKRIRAPRVFLTSQHYYKNYDVQESDTMAFLQHLSTRYLNAQVLFISVNQNKQINQIKSLVLTTKYLIYVNITTKKIEKEIDVSDIQSIQIENQSLTVETNRTHLNITDCSYRQLYLTFQKLYKQ